MNSASWGWRGGEWGPSQVRLLFWPLPEPQVRLWSSGKAAMVWPLLEVSQERDRDRCYLGLGLWALAAEASAPGQPASIKPPRSHLPGRWSGLLVWSQGCGFGLSRRHREPMPQHPVGPCPETARSRWKDHPSSGQRAGTWAICT